jgi:uncharacterized RDD family membrane protein YckC
MTRERGAEAPPPDRTNPMAGQEAPSPAVAPVGHERAPPLMRRLACFVYEGMLLFGVALVPALLATLAFRRTDIDASPLAGHLVRGLAIAVYAAYFAGCWSARGQTLAMQTWRIRLVAAGGGPVRPARALARFGAGCLGWFGPALIVTAAGDLALAPKLGAIATGIVLYALLALAAPGRQFWHDLVCGTRLVDVRGGEPAGPSVRPRPR